MKEIYEEMLKSEAHSKAKGYLSHVFVMLPAAFNPEKDDISDFNLQFGFYDKDSGKITTVSMENNEFIAGPPEDPMGKHEIEELSLDEVKVDAKGAFEKLSELIKEKYKGNIPLKTIVILHKDKGVLVWNITVLRSDFKTLNMKLNAGDGSVIDDSLKGLIEVDK